jgi:hypothetical protein
MPANVADRFAVCTLEALVFTRKNVDSLGSIHHCPAIQAIKMVRNSILAPDWCIAHQIRIMAVHSALFSDI